MLKFGYITELNTDKGTVRVHFDEDDIVSNPLPVSVPASKNDKYSFPFSINEHVWCLMDENCEYGVVGGAIYSAKDSVPSGASEQTIDINIGANKLQITINRTNGNLTLKSEGDVKIDCVNADIKATTATLEATGETAIKGSTVTIQAANTNVSGNMAVTGTVEAASIAAGGFGGLSGGPLQATANIQTDGDVVANGISLTTHVHPTTTEGSPTGLPE
jgi:phage baseplate assembly protein gpV